MLGRMMIAVRLTVVLTFLVGMPLLALPQVADWCEAKLYVSAVAKHSQIAAKPGPAHPSPPAFFPRAIEPASFTHPFESTAHAASPEGATPTAPVASAPHDPLADRQEIAQLEAELQRLGAIFYRLEAPESPSLTYRFVAQFERQAGLPERFQVTTTHADPLVAIRQMVDQVQSRTSVARP